MKRGRRRTARPDGRAAAAYARRGAATLRASLAGLLLTTASAPDAASLARGHAIPAPPPLLDRATRAASAPVHLVLDGAPLETVLELAAAAADLELTLPRPLEGELSGTLEGTLADVLGRIAERVPAVYDIEADLLEALPGTASTRTRLVGKASTVGLDAVVRDEPGRRLPGNSVALDGPDLVVAGHPRFVARTLAAVGALAGPPPERARVRPPAPPAEPVVTAAPPTSSTSSGPPRPPEPPEPLDGLEAIPGFDTF